MDYIIDVPKIWGPIPPPPQGWTWDSLMDEALYEACQSAKKGEVPIGAIVVHKKGKIMARSHNNSITNADPTAHAEILALRAAGKILQNYRLHECLLIVTLEPCLMCTGAIIHSRIEGIVYGATEQKTGAIISCIHGLELSFHNHKPWHLGGIKGKQCSEILKHFFYQLRE